MSINFMHTDAKQQWLTQRLKNFKKTKSSSEITPQSRPTNLPLSFAQQRLWFLDQWEPGSPAYLLPYAWRLVGPLDRAALAHSVATLVGRHESLRTSFSMVDGQPVQVIAAATPVSLPVRDLTALPASDREPELQRLIHADTQQPFDLATPPLWRSQLLSLGPEDHVLLLTLHHIITDGWSMDIVWKELRTLYTAHVAGQPAPLAPLPLQYADFAVWQRQWLQGDVLEQQITYWHTQLADLPPSLNLPTAGPRPPHQTYRGKQLSFTLPSTLLQALTALSRHEGVTLFMTLLAAFQLLLCRYTGQRDILVGIPIAGRTHTGLEGLIGFFVNTLVLRTRFTGQSTFQDVLQQVRATCLEAYAHQDLPFEKLVEALQPVRDPSRHPLFQVMFQLHHGNLTDGLTFPQLQVESLRGTTQTAKFDLLVALVATKEKLQGTLTFNTDLFAPETMRRLAMHYQKLLEGLVANPTQAVSHMSLLPDAERHQLLIEWNETTREYPRDKCVHELFEEHVECTPDAIVSVFEDQQMTYRELNKRANQLAHFLKEQGVGPEVHVGICLERGLELVISLLGILKAGGAYVPLDVNYPQQRLAFMLEDAAIQILVTQHDVLKRLPGNGIQAVCLDILASTLAKQNSRNLRQHTRPENLAYVMYTSGSTGTPKGVEIAHASIVRLVIGSDYVNLSPDRVFLQLAPLSFDASTFELWGGLLQGAKLVLPPNGLPDFAELEEVIKKHQVTTLWLTASLFNQVVEQCPQVLTSVEQILTGGEALSVPHIRMAQTKLGPNVQLINGYGPTENTTFTSCYSIPASLPHNMPSIPIGRPIANTQTYVLDSHLKPVPVGIPGELYIGGEGLARNYWNRPECTAERFCPDPFSAFPGARLYQTGDLAWWRQEGVLEFLGRSDSQIKLRGYRIELGEIEAVLSQHSAVQEAAVVAREDEPGDKRLVAYVVANQEQWSPSDLRRHLKQTLPAYMIPSVFVGLETFPLTPNGKIDRHALPAPEAGRSEFVQDFAAPSTQAERQITQVWEEVLGIVGIGIHDNFFALGGHSLLATQIMTRIKARLQMDLSLRTFFEQPTVASLAQAIQQTQKPPDAATTEEDLAALLNSVEALSEEEAQALLETETLEKPEKEDGF